jgi:hypothetical protein
VALVFPRTPRRYLRVALDAVVLLWVGAWILIGLAVSDQVRGLTDLSGTVTTAGLALEEAGNALATLESVPFVGENMKDVGERTARAGRSARASGRSSRESIESLSVLLGVSIAVAPSLPLLLLYVPMRVGWARQVRDVRRALAAAPDDPALEQFLAWQAALNLPYGRLREVTPDPWGDLAAGRHRPLSDAELDRLGVRRPHSARRA